MEEKEYLCIVVAKQVACLMKQADLTIKGLAEGANLTTHTIVKILNADTRISPKTATKLADFFGVTVASLFSEKEIKIKITETVSLKNFYKNNQSNNIYFESRAKENVIAHFFKKELINDPFLNTGKRAKEIAEYIKTKSKYKKDFNPKVIAKVLDRMQKLGLLIKEDKTGKGAVFYYRLAKPVKY